MIWKNKIEQYNNKNIFFYYIYLISSKRLVNIEDMELESLYELIHYNASALFKTA